MAIINFEYKVTKNDHLIINISEYFSGDKEMLAVLIDKKFLTINQSTYPYLSSNGTDILIVFDRRNGKSIESRLEEADVILDKIRNSIDEFNYFRKKVSAVISKSVIEKITNSKNELLKDIAVTKDISETHQTRIDSIAEKVDLLTDKLESFLERLEKIEDQITKPKRTTTKKGVVKDA